VYARQGRSTSTAATATARATAPPAGGAAGRATTARATTGVAAGVTAGALGIAALGLPTVLAGCGSGSEPVTVTSSGAQVRQDDPRSRLAALAAAAKDRRFTAGYTLTRPGRRGQAVLTTLAGDGTWRVDVQAGAVGGSVDVSVVGRPDGQYQCGLSGSSTGCVRVAALGRRLPSGIDPLVQVAFTTWTEVLTDPTVAITVVVSDRVTGAAGTCFGIEPTTVTLTPPIESSIACYGDDGTLTAARSGFGTLIMSGTPVPAPATVALPRRWWRGQRSRSRRPPPRPAGRPAPVRAASSRRPPGRRPRPGHADPTRVALAVGA
jgi:hypothetical protein